MSVFRFKQFNVIQDLSAMKIGTDAMLLGSLVEMNNISKIVDVGSGTGVIGLMLAQKYQDASITGVEMDESSYLETKMNYQNSPWNYRLTPVHSDFLLYESDQQFDCIVSNPPYYQTRLENTDVRKSQARHESALPVAGMIRKVSELLLETGSFWVIIPVEVISCWEENTSKYDFSIVTKISIRGRENGPIKRYVLEFRRKSGCLVEREIIIRKTDGKYSEQYIALTQDFHFNDLRATP